MTIGTFNFMVGDMFFMHERFSVLCSQQALVLMTLKTFPFGHVAIALKNMNMTLLTSNPSGNILSVIEIPTFHLNIPFGFDMTGFTASYCTRNAFFFSLWAGLIEMADKAIGFMNSKMSPLNKLGMAGSATKFHPPS